MGKVKDNRDNEEKRKRKDTENKIRQGIQKTEDKEKGISSLQKKNVSLLMILQNKTSLPMLLNSLMKNRIVTFGKTQCFYSPMKISRLRSLIKTEERKYDINIYIYGIHVSMYMGKR